MSWQTKSVMEQREKFIMMWKSNNYTVTALCKSFGISRRTGYNLINKYKKLGDQCFEDRSKVPTNTPHKTPIEIEEKIVELRRKHETWGARKFKKLLEQNFEISDIPSETTINAILKRNDLIKDRKKRSKKIGKQNPEFDPNFCNEIWSADYKGKFIIKNKRHCWPLTICDSKSRKMLGIDCHYKPTYNAVKQSYIKAFREHGLPSFMHTDNGSPFGNTQSICRYTKLSYWLIDHEILPIYSDPGCPQQNGRHERMHRDLKAYCKTRIGTTLSKQQVVMDLFRDEYNIIRPHESLQMQTPNEVHIRSEREFKEKIPEYDYPDDFRKYKVTKNGAMRWKSYYWVKVSQGAAGKYIGAEEVDHGIWNLYYRNVLLGYIDEKVFYRRNQYQSITRLKV